MEPSVKRLMLVDDHSIVRAGIRQLLKECPDIVVDCEAANGQEALTLLHERPVDAVLLDLSMPGRSGLEILGRIKAERPELPVLIVSIHTATQFAINALRTGASGYLSKATASDELISAIRTVLGGGKYVSEALASKLTEGFMLNDDGREPHEKLSPREFDVMCHLAAGKSVSEIAIVLFVSSKTVRTHRARILDKMALKSNADLAYYAIKHSLIE